tara:strand:- start:287 stop:937 length:651 start_codon:yes stop_codon:yes gene_type:complete
MKPYFKFLVLLFTLVIMISCKNEEKKDDKVEDVSEKVEKNKSSSKKKSNSEVKNNKVFEEKGDKFAQYMNDEMESYTILPEALWLQPEFVTDINNTEGIKEKISYPKSVSIEGDFNGDGFTDHAAFMQDQDDKVYLMSFHQTEEGFDRFVLMEEEKISECCLARGISITPPGIYFEKDSKKENVVKSDGIIYNFYANSKYIWYFNGKGYIQFQIEE